MDKKMRKSGNNKISYQRTNLISGFTLIELLIVMVIIGLLAALVVPKLIDKVGKAKSKTAKAQLELFSTAIDLYKLDIGKYPSQDTGLQSLITKPGDAQNWDGPYMKKEKIPKDPWGADYIYTYPGAHGDYDIVSYGADGSEGGSGDNQDLVSWE